MFQRDLARDFANHAKKKWHTKDALLSKFRKREDHFRNHFPMYKKDSARSWIVLAVATFSMFLEIGTIKSYSVLLPVLHEQLDTHTWVVGSSIAIMSGFGYMAGLSAGVLVRFCEPRTCIIASGVLAGLGLIISSMATNPSILLIGLILTGFLLVQETFLLGIIPEYFDKYYERAVGIYSSGTAFGILTLPLVTQQLLGMYGWRWTLLLLSGLVFHSVPLGMLVCSKDREMEENKPLISPRDRQNSYDVLQSKPLFIPDDHQNSNGVPQSKPLILPDNCQNSNRVPQSKPLIFPDNRQNSNDVLQSKSLIFPDNRQNSNDVLQSKSLIFPDNRQNSNDLLQSKSLIFRDNRQNSKDLSQSKTPKQSNDVLQSILSNALGLSLLTEVGYITRVFIPSLSLGYNLTGWMIYVVSYAISNGASLKSATIVVTYGGVGILMVRIVGTPILHHFVTYKTQIYVSSVIMSLCLILMTIFESYTGMCILSFMFGAAIGVFGTEIYISAKMNCKETEHFQSMAWLNLAFGIASLSTGFITGFTFDMTGSFAVSFYILAAVSAASTVSLAIGDIITQEGYCMKLKYSSANNNEHGKGNW